MTSTKYIELQSDRIAYREVGEGRPILLLHSSSASSRVFHLQFESALASRLRLVAMDFPGHGESSNATAPERSYSMRGLAQVVAGFMEALSLRGSVVVGSSMGGNIALEVAASGPSSIAGIMLVGSAPVANDPSRIPDAFVPTDDFGLLFQEKLSNEEAAVLARKLVQGSDVWDFVYGDVVRADGRFRRIWGESVMRGELADEAGLVGRLDIPLAVVLGEGDRVMNASYLRALTYANLWRGEVQTVAGAGHAPHIQAPEFFNDLLLAFVDEIAPAARLANVPLRHPLP